MTTFDLHDALLPQNPEALAIQALGGLYSLHLTAYGVVEGVVFILTNLCPIWLALCALGYGLMSVGMRSHAFTAASLVHSVAIIAMPFQAHWQLMDTGLVIAYTLFFFSVIPWDMQASETDNPC